MHPCRQITGRATEGHQTGLGAAGAPDDVQSAFLISVTAFVTVKTVRSAAGTANPRSHDRVSGRNGA